MDFIFVHFWTYNSYLPTCLYGVYLYSTFDGDFFLQNFWQYIIIIIIIIYIYIYIYIYIFFNEYFAEVLQWTLQLNKFHYQTETV